MGVIPIRTILSLALPTEESHPVSGLKMPETVQVTRVDFESERQEPVFEGETRMRFRLCQRDWRYRRHGEEKVRVAHRWRLELLVDADAAEPLCPGHFIVMAQEPYSNQWLQYAKLLRYSKKERVVPELPPNFPAEADPVEWLERTQEVDPWEQSARYVAGISFPNGFWTSEPRNTAGDLLLGTCPDRERAIEKLLQSRTTRNLLRAAERNTLRVAYPTVNNGYPLLPAVIDEAPILMHNAIQQALAGPSSLENWARREVANLAGQIFRDHLNNRNRVLAREARHETSRDLEKLPDWEDDHASWGEE